MKNIEIHNYSLSFLSYLWLMNQSVENFEVKPIISPRSLKDLLDYLKAETLNKDITKDILEGIEGQFNFHKSLINEYPLFDLEK